MEFPCGLKTYISGAVYAGKVDSCEKSNDGRRVRVRSGTFDLETVDTVLVHGLGTITDRELCHLAPRCRRQLSTDGIHEVGQEWCRSSLSLSSLRRPRGRTSRLLNAGWISGYMRLEASEMICSHTAIATLLALF